MTIRSISSPYAAPRVGAPSTPPTKDAPASGPTPSAATPSAAARQDSVSISDAARALAGDQAAGVSGASLTPARVAELRQKVLSGAYNSTHAVDVVARRLLSRGDV